MPLMIAKIEGAGNGIKTAIPNMVDVAKALSRPPSYPTKYLGCELGAQTQMYPDDERYIVNGAFQAERFQELLDGFIKRFVLCSACGNPETKMTVKRKTIELACRACGHRYEPKPHKLSTFILKNPPGGAKKEEEKGGKKGKARKGDVDQDKGGAGGTTSSMSSLAGSSQGAVAAMRTDGGGMTDFAPEAVEIDDDDIKWSVDTSEEAVRARTQEEVGSGVAHLTMSDDLDKPIGERLKILDGFVRNRLKLPKLPAKEIVGEAERLDCKEKGVTVMVELLLGGTDDVVKMLKTHAKVFQRFTFDESKAQKYALGAMEVLVAERPALMNKVARIWKELFDLDIIEEEVFLAWSEKASKKQVGKDLSIQIHAKAAPFITWLKEADEETSSEDEDIAFGTEEPVTAPADSESSGVGATSPTEAVTQDDEESDIDLDDI